MALHVQNLHVFVSEQIYLGGSSDFVNGAVVVDKDIGKIVAVLKSPSEVKHFQNLNSNLEMSNFGSKILMPGLIDSHVHVNEPGRTEWEGFATATKAAAAGGFTTIVDMPLNSIPATTTVENLKTKLNAARGKLFVDVAFWGGFIPENIDDLLAMVDYGVVGFKCFLCPSGVPEFPHVHRDDVERALTILEKSDSVLAFHAEVDSSCCSIQTTNENASESTDPYKFQTYIETRPPTMETDAIEMVLEMAQKHPKTNLHIVHLSSSDSLPLIQKARESCQNLTVETCHHYLALDSDHIPDGHTEFKCCPPIRDKSNQEKLWHAIQKREIDLIVSDHSPSTAEMKLLGPSCEDAGNFLKAWGGISSNQFGLSLFWTHCGKYGLGIADLHRLLCAAPAKLCGLSESKGRIDEEFDADFCVWDPNEEFTVNLEDIQFRNKMTPYLNMTLKGVVHTTVVRGEVVYSKEEEFGTPSGKILLRPRRTFDSLIKS